MLKRDEPLAQNGILTAAVKTRHPPHFDIAAPDMTKSKMSRTLELK